MAKGHYEREQERLMRLWAQLEEEELEDQIQLDDDDESLAADELETQDHNCWDCDELREWTVFLMCLLSISILQSMNVCMLRG
nr:unnamed protein product [Callosobruchus chinensis]